MTSRLLDRPASGAIKGPSSAGKSHLVDKVLEFFPSSAFYALSAMSERALAYSEEPLRHRVLVLYEAAGLSGDFASYLVRSLLSEGCVRYETVEKTSEGLRSKLIEREGPTGLLVTTTAVSLHAENETRLISIPVTDTREQTRAVLLSLATESDGPAVDTEPWHALQAWIEGGPRQVTIPWATTLAELIPPVAVRLRRDFGAVLALTRAHALLHQAGRVTDSHGRVVATLDDYAAVRELVADLVAEGVEATVPPTVRETVEAVRKLITAGVDETTVKAVATALTVDKSTALRRVQVAIERGHLKNLEDRKGRPARLVLGDPLPDDLAILPTVETLADALDGCRVADETDGSNQAPTPAPDDDWAIF